MNTSAIRVLTIIKSSEIVSRIESVLLETLKNVEMQLATSIEEARQMLSAHVPSVIILDINMPEQVGMEFIREIKIEQPNAMVIVYTNSSEKYYRDKCKQLGADYFFDQSFEVSYMLLALSDMTQ
jgi:DNA-binding NarL/FixJ family response regulator